MIENDEIVRPLPSKGNPRVKLMLRMLKILLMHCTKFKGWEEILLAGRALQVQMQESANILEQLFLTR